MSVNPKNLPDGNSDWQYNKGMYLQFCLDHQDITYSPDDLLNLKAIGMLILRGYLVYCGNGVTQLTKLGYLHQHEGNPNG